MFEEKQSLPDTDDNQHYHDTDRDESTLHLELVIEEQELIEILQDKAPGRVRTAYAHAALKIGLLALEQANSRIDAERIRDEGVRLVENFSTAMQSHRDAVHQDVAKSLADYFDPQSGRLTQRVERLIQKDGELEKVIRAQIDGDGSPLAHMLKQHLGENSTLLKLIDPDSDKGFAARLTQNLDVAVREQRDVILKEFSLDNPQGALTRTVRELTQKHGAAGEALQEKIGEMVAEFSLDKDDSALSKLVQQVKASQKLLSDEFSLDKEGSALARMQKELLDRINVLSKTQNEFQHEMQVQLKEMAARKAESLKSTSHGIDFEEAVYETVQCFLRPRGDIVTRTGNTTGRVARCKVGDMVIELGPEHAAAGAKIVIEAKQNASYNVAKARAEMEEARKNRDADIGIFIFSNRSAPEGFARLSRYGGDVFLIWDADDENSDIVLEAGLSLATAMSVRGALDTGAHSVDFAVIEKALLAIEQQISSLDEFDQYSKSLSSTSDKMNNRTRIMRNQLTKQLHILKDSVDSVKAALE